MLCGLLSMVTEGKEVKTVFYAYLRTYCKLWQQFWVSNYFTII